MLAVIGFGKSSMNPTSFGTWRRAGRAHMQARLFGKFGRRHDGRPPDDQRGPEVELPEDGRGYGAFLHTRDHASECCPRCTSRRVRSRPVLGVRRVGRGRRSRKRRTSALWFRREPRRKCRPVVRSRSRRTRSLRASVASPHGAARRQFSRSIDQRHVWPRSALGDRWRCRRTATHLSVAALGEFRRTRPACRRRG